MILAPIAYLISIPNKIVNAGVIIIPPPSPTKEPRNPAKTAIIINCIISIAPIYEDTKMSIKNSKYEVENLVLTLNRPNATSNEFANEKAIELEVSSNVLVIYSKD